MAPSVAFVSHGGGPLPLLGHGDHAELVRDLRQLSGAMTKPSAIVLISAHWEEDAPTVTSGASTELLYDYHGFPADAYTIQYPAPGAPELAADVVKCLTAAGFDTRTTSKRGLDHGVFVPLKLMYPDADVPVVQLSMVRGYDPEAHMRMGEALRDSLRTDVSIIGSGMTFHNMGALMSPESKGSEYRGNAAFEGWLTETLGDGPHTLAERRRALMHWASAPAARFCQPREDHLTPLFVCFGASSGSAARVWTSRVMGWQTSSNLWRQPEVAQS